jgi:plastocyanin
MKHNYLFATIAAILVVGIGIFLLGRDGTENESSSFSASQNERSEELPLNENISSTSTIDSPILEGDESTTSSEVIDLSNTATSSNEESDVGIVTYTDSGFSPKTITIEQGDAVTFINNSSRNMWVASNRHPTHNEYPEESDEDCLGSSFDACRGISVGDSWIFTFDYVGEWGYHDHLNASRTGTVIVE